MTARHIALALWLVALTILAIAWTMMPAGAQERVCFSAEAVLQSFRSGGETPAFVGAHKSGALMIVMLNPKTGEWTIMLQVSPNTICATGLNGDGWELAAERT